MRGVPHDVQNRGLAPEATADVERALTQALLDEREQASLRAEAARVLSGLLHPERTVARTLHLLVPRFASWGLAVVADEPAGSAATSSAGTTARFPRQALSSPRDGAIRRTVRAGRRQRWQMEGPEELASLVPDVGLRAELPDDGPLSVLLLPLRAAGETFGGLLLVRRADDDFDDRATTLCEDVAQTAALALQAARLYAARAHTARVLQDSLRPRALPDIPGVRLASSYRSTSSGDDVGGDFYDVHGAGDDWSLVIGDVSGSGIEAAVLTGQARQALRTAGLVDRSPTRMLGLANRSLLQTTGARFVTILCCRLVVGRPGPARLEVASAGHPPPLIARADGSIEEPVLRGMAAGLFADGDHPSATVDLAPGDRCLLYTDGITEARSPDGTFFGTERLRQALSACSSAEPGAVAGYVTQQVLEHLAGGHHDDIALLAIGVAP
jgi:phosphoserine phosphatase RsbU/P